MTRDILTPVEDTMLAVTGGGRAFWKRILPLGSIDYYDDKGSKHKLDFSAKYLDDVKASFENRILDQTPFMLADNDNKHTMDPERFRGEVTKMRMGGKDGPGLYARIKFPDDKAAAAVLANHKLGVSARLREDVKTADGRKAPVAMIHVLGTLDPKITNLGDWEPDTDLSGYAPTEVIDLSNQSYPEDRMGKRKAKTWDFATLTAEDIETGKGPTEDDIEKMSDEDLEDFTARLGELAADGGDEDPDDDDDDDDDTDEDDDEPKSKKDKGKGKGKDTQMSNDAQRQIDLANARATQADERAAATEKRITDREWKEKRSRYIRMGIPPEKIDLCKPVLARPNELVVDLSNTSYGGDKETPIAAIVEDLLLGYQGTINIDVELGHTHTNDDDPTGGLDLDEELNKKYEQSFPHMVNSSVLNRVQG